MCVAPSYEAGSQTQHKEEKEEASCSLEFLSLLHDCNLSVAGSLLFLFKSYPCWTVAPETVSLLSCVCQELSLQQQEK